MNKNNNERYNIPKEQLRNKSSWLDAILGRVRTDEPNNCYENLPTKLSSTFYNHGKFYGLLKKLYMIYCNIVGPFHILPDFLFLAPGACGTTSMVELYLRSNENILPSKINEIFYFNTKHTNSINWYKVLFPVIFDSNQIKQFFIPWLKIIAKKFYCFRFYCNISKPFWWSYATFSLNIWMM